MLKSVTWSVLLVVGVGQPVSSTAFATLCPAESFDKRMHDWQRAEVPDVTDSTVFMTDGFGKLVTVEPVRRTPQNLIRTVWSYNPDTGRLDSASEVIEHEVAAIPRAHCEPVFAGYGSVRASVDLMDREISVETVEGRKPPEDFALPLKLSVDLILPRRINERNAEKARITLRYSRLNEYLLAWNGFGFVIFNAQSGETLAEHRQDKADRNPIRLVDWMDLDSVFITDNMGWVMRFEIPSSEPHKVPSYQPDPAGRLSRLYRDAPTNLRQQRLLWHNGRFLAAVANTPSFEVHLIGLWAPYNFSESTYRITFGSLPHNRVVECRLLNNGLLVLKVRESLDSDETTTHLVNLKSALQHDGADTNGYIEIPFRQASLQVSN